MSHQTRVLKNIASSSLRAWRGSLAYKPVAPPEKALKLYDIEASPYCRLVREVLTELDLDVMILPCPQGGTRFRAEAEALGGKQLFPLLHDENTQTVLYESRDIVSYLYRQYRGKTKSRRHALAVASSYLATGVSWSPKGYPGMVASPSKAPAQPLTLFSFESSPYSKTVRDVLCELELPYLLRNTGKGRPSDIGPPNFRDKIFKGEMGTSRNRKWLQGRTGKVQVPYLIDPNTGTEMYESAKIVAYLRRTYGA